MISILIADDHTLFREALIGLLQADGRFEVAGEAETGQEAIEKNRVLKPDIVILDVYMPGRGGLETIAEIKRLNPKTKVLMVTMHPEDDYAIRCLKAGADGYFTKSQATQELTDGLMKIWKGGKYISPQLAENLALYLDVDAEQPKHASLSNRELEVLRMIASARTVSQIADELALSVKTVSTYRARILEKMHLSNNAELMHYGITNGLVSDIDS